LVEVKRAQARRNRTMHQETIQIQKVTVVPQILIQGVIIMNQTPEAVKIQIVQLEMKEVLHQIGTILNQQALA
jgi:hypothetical protein